MPMTPTDLFDAARRCLETGEADDKVRLTLATAESWRRGELDFAPHSVCLPRLGSPGLPAKLRLVLPAEVPRRRLRGKSGSAALIHALAHIEFNAINLAWDCLERFRGLPRAYYDDWVSVALDEALHFDLLQRRLRDLGLDYGDLPAHGGLWEMAEKTAGDPIARMALVPRHLEARGLDVAPAMIEKLERVGDEASAAIVRRILDDEVGHVRIGSRWFRHLCAGAGLEADREFSRLLDRYEAGGARGPLNVEARERAGFSAGEIDALHARRTCVAKRQTGRKPIGV